MRAALGVALSLSLVPAAGASPPDKYRDDRLSWELHLVAAAAERGAPLRGLSRWVAPDADNVTAVVELAEGATPQALEEAVRAFGGRVEAFQPLWGWGRIEVPARGLRALSREPGIALVRAPFTPTRKAVVSEGTSLEGADEFVARTGADGTGVLVGVLDSAWADVETRIAEGELPAATELTPDVTAALGSYDSAHGTACAEIVHDVAPGAGLLLAGLSDEVGWTEALEALATRGVRIVSHSLGFDNLYPLDGDSPFARFVDQLHSRGMLFVTAAGNEASGYYHGSWSDPDADGRLDFVPGVEMLPLKAFPDSTLVRLRWDDRIGASGHDFDLYLVSADFAANPALEDNPAVLASSHNPQNGRGIPREFIELPVDDRRDVFAVVVHDDASPLKPDQQFWLWTSGLVLEHGRAEVTLTHPAEARGATSVGAAWIGDGLVETYSSRGPTDDGRTKPDLLAHDGVSTASYGERGFFGTSAATPHAAGVAALLLSRNPGLDVAALEQALAAATVTGGQPDLKNNLVGFGLLDLRRVP